MMSTYNKSYQEYEERMEERSKEEYISDLEGIVEGLKMRIEDLEDYKDSLEASLKREKETGKDKLSKVLQFVDDLIDDI